MMALLNNWDLQAYNNSVYVVGGERRYLVNDMGATFGKTGNNFVRSKSVLKDYANSKFVDKVSPEFVSFMMESRPFAASVIKVGNYKTRTRMEAITEHIPAPRSNGWGKSSVSFPRNRSATASARPATRPQRSRDTRWRSRKESRD